MGLKTQIKNENDKIEEDSEIILINYYGSVLKYYENFKQIFIGKSLIKKLEKMGQIQLMLLKWVVYFPWTLCLKFQGNL